MSHEKNLLWIDLFNLNLNQAKREMVGIDSLETMNIFTCQKYIHSLREKVNRNFF